VTITTAPEGTPPVEFLALSITGRCQLACSHCFSSSGPDGTHGMMTTGDWERLLREAAAMGVRRVQFIGGEPTLHPSLVRLARYAVTAGLRVEVFTNLVHVTAEQWEAFGLPGVSLATSYYSPDPEAHAQITGRRGSHARTRANLAEALRRGITVRGAVVDVSGDGDAEAARAELAVLGIIAQPADRVRQVGRAASLRGVAPALSELCGLCGQGRAAVSADGDVSPCSISAWMTAGSVRERPLAEIIATARWRELAASIPGPRASDCLPSCKPSLGDGGDCAPAEQPACNPDYCNPDRG
jgi:MoaA/NifB/PqqE/SkfB family radical SAM enzyme